MAKNNNLYRLVLGFVICFCTGIGCALVACQNQGNLNSVVLLQQNDTILSKNSIYRSSALVSEENRIANTRQKVKSIYDSQIGIREATGRNDGVQVEAYLRYTGLGKGHAWCAAFVCWVLGEAGVENPKTAWAASLFPQDKLVWPHAKVRATHNTQPTTKKVPATGNPPAYRTGRQLATIFGLYFPSLKRIAHCGFVDEWGEKEVITVEGNTNDNGSREGDGVYRKRRPVKSLYAVADWIGGAKP